MTDEVAKDALAAFSNAELPKERASLLDQNPALASPATVQALYDRVAHYLRVDLSAAELAARSCLWLAHRLQHTESIALSLRGLGNVQLFQDQPLKALEQYRQALQLFTQGQLREQIAQTNMNIFTAFLSAGDYERAHATALTARKQLSALNDTQVLARLENNLGTLFFRQENFQQAREHWQAALSTFRTLGHSQDAAVALRNLAVCEISLNNFHEALGIYGEVSQYCKQNNLTLLLHEIDYNIAYLHFLRGDHDRALQGYRFSRERSLELGDSYHAALCDLDESELYLELNLLPDAVSLAQRATAAFAEIGKPYEAAKALAFEAAATARMGEDHQALDLLRHAHEAFALHGHSAWASLTLLYKALVYLREGRRFEAHRCAAKALQGFSKIDNPGKSALCHILLGHLQMDAGDLVSAQISARTALSLVSTVDLPHVLFQAYFLVGEIEELLGNPEVARSSYYSAVELLKPVRTQLTATDLHIPFPHNRLAVYDRLLHLEGLLALPADLPKIAFSLVEQEKAQTISDLLGSRAAAIAPSRPARSGLVEQVRGLREELRWYYKKMSQRELLEDQHPVSDATPSFHAMEKRLLASLQEISKVDQEFGHLHQIVSIDPIEVQELLGEDELVMEYFVGEDVITLVLLSQRDCSCQPIAISSEVSELRRQLDFQASRNAVADTRADGRQRSIEPTKQCLSRLYQELVAPVASQLRRFSRLKIVPHGFLAYLPFHAFVDEGTDLRELGRRFMTSYLPSVAALVFGRRRIRDQRRRSALVFEGGVADAGSPLLREPWQGEVIPLGTPRDEWQARLREPWGVLHLPLNAVFRLDSPALSDISLAGSRMTLLDLFQIELRADVVVVTDCAPSPARQGAGDELLCLSRSLLYSGPLAVVMPLRRGRPEAQEVVLRSFYAALAAGQPADAALQLGQSACKSEFPHMADWASLAVYGL